MYSCGPLHMDEQKQDDQLEPTYKSSMPIWDVALKTYWKQWMIERGGERGSGISMLMAQHQRNCHCYLLQTIDVGVHVECENIWEGELRHNITITSDYPKQPNVEWVFDFHQNEYEPVLRLKLKLWNLCIEPSSMNANSTACCFQISGGVNCIIVLLFSQIVPNWL